MFFRGDATCPRARAAGREQDRHTDMIHRRTLVRERATWPLRRARNLARIMHRGCLSGRRHKSLRAVKSQCSQAFSPPRRPLRDDRHGTTDCSVPGSVRQAAGRRVQPRPGQLRRRGGPASRWPSAPTAWSRRSPGVCSTSGRRTRPGTRSRIWSASASSASPAAIATATMATASPTTRSTSCCSTETRFRVSAWPRSRRCRGSRTRSTAARSTVWRTSWPRGSSSGIAAG